MSERIPASVSSRSERPAGSRASTVSVGRVEAWRRRPAPPSGPAGGSEPSETPVWTGPAGPAAPQPAARGSVRSVGCYLPANTEDR